MKKLMSILGVVLALSLFGGCAWSVRVPADMVAVHIGGGSAENKKPKGCKDAGTNDFGPTNDEYVLFPTGEREWEAVKDGSKAGGDGGRYSSVTNDNVVMLTPGTTRFSLITDCKTLTAFYLKYAKAKGIKFNSDGKFDNDEERDAWNQVLRKLVAKATEATLDLTIQEYNWRDVWNDPSTRTEIERLVNERLPSQMEKVAKGEYFEGITFVIDSPQPENGELAAAVAKEQTNVAAARSAEAQAKAETAQALAEVAVAKAQAQKREAEVQGYGGKDGYLKAKAIDKGLNPFQPTYVVSGSAR